MSRNTKNFIEAYKAYTIHSEAPTLYHIWTALFMMSAAVRRKVKFSAGYFDIYPNLYIVFISPPGKGKKSTAAEIGIKILKELGDIQMSSESITREALIRDLSKASATYPGPEGQAISHCSLSIFSSEWSVFLGHKNSGNESMIALLTDLFGCPDKWTYRTKLSGTDHLENVFLNKLACTTFDYLASSLPMDAIGGGLTSRVIFIVEFKKRKKSSLGELSDLITPEEYALKELLKQDLEDISQCCGEMTFTDEAKKFFNDWYHEQDDEKPSIADERFFGYIERKPMHIIKTSMLMSLAEGDSLKIGMTHLLSSFKLFEQTEIHMPNAFGARGRSIIAVDLERILFQIVAFWKENPQYPMARRQLAKANYRHVDPDTLRKILTQLEEMGEIEMRHSGGDFQITYTGEFIREKK